MTDPTPVDQDAAATPADTAPAPPATQRGFTRRQLLRGGGALFVGGGLLSLCGACAFSAPRYEGPPSDHFDGKMFFLKGAPQRDLGDVWKWQRTRTPAKWPPFEDRPPAPAPPREVGGRDLRATFINHATVLLQCGGLNVLTDPVFSPRVGPVSWAGPKRVIPPGVRFEDLPRIDAVVISHNHYDHLDLPTLKRLVAAHNPQIFTPLGVAQYLHANEIPRAADLDWWQQATLGAAEPLRLTCVPAAHWSGRGLCDRSATLWAGYMLEFRAGTVFFAGDTAHSPHFLEIARRFPDIRLSLLPIGAYEARWFMQAAHMNPEDAVRAHGEMRSRHSLAIHWGTFHLADEARLAPVQDLAIALQRAGIPATKFIAPEAGYAFDVPA